MKRSHPAGFTLVELSALLAVTVTLGAVLFPVLSAARARSRQALCASQLAQNGSAFPAGAGSTAARGSCRT